MFLFPGPKINVEIVFDTFFFPPDRVHLIYLTLLSFIMSIYLHDNNHQGDCTRSSEEDGGGIQRKQLAYDQMISVSKHCIENNISLYLLG